MFKQNHVFFYWEINYHLPSVLRVSRVRHSTNRYLISHTRKNFGSAPSKMALCLLVDVSAFIK